MSLSKWLSSATKFTKNLALKRQAIAAKIQADPYYRFESVTEIKIAGELGLKIDVNQASIDEWLRLPGISIHQARSLVELTHAGVQFFCLEDLGAALGVSVAKIKIWQPILYFCYYDRESWDTPAKINPNSASLEELKEIPVIEPNLAQKILINRQQKGNYRNLADFKQRLSLDSDSVYQLMYYLKF